MYSLIALLRVSVFATGQRVPLCGRETDGPSRRWPRAGATNGRGGAHPGPFLVGGLRGDAAHAPPGASCQANSSGDRSLRQPRKCGLLSGVDPRPGNEPPAARSLPFGAASARRSPPPRPGSITRAAFDRYAPCVFAPSRQLPLRTAERERRATYTACVRKSPAPRAVSGSAGLRTIRM